MAQLFEKHYNVYSSLKEGFDRMENPFNFGFYRPFKEGESIRTGDIVREGGSYYLIKGRCLLFAAGRKGYHFSEGNLALGLKRECCCGKKQPYRKCFYHSGRFGSGFLVFDEPFFKHMVDLPLEYHNPIVNKFVLKNIEEPYWVLNLLINEYKNKGKHFEEYFSCLSSERKGRLVDEINSLGHRDNVKVDSFIRRQGFNINSLGYLVLYKENSEDFMKYFTSKCDSERKIILRNVMDSDFINEKIIDWLNEHYSDLIIKVRSSQ